MKRMVQILMGLSILGTSIAALAEDDGRCQFMDNKGVIPYEVAERSNAWGVFCSKLTAAEAAELNKEHKYAIYTGDNGRFLITTPPQYFGPTPTPPAVNTACNVYPFLDANFIKRVGVCSAGCYTPDQELQFDGQYMSIERAFARDAKTVTAMSALSTELQPQFAEQSIKSFVTGETKETIYTLQGEGGEQLTVTGEHPMVTGDGYLVAARDLKEGDALLGADGHLIVLGRISTRPYSGWVFNVKPQSEKKIENIVVAQGYLTGSNRFQNEWANEAFRLQQRDSLDLSAP